MPNYGANRIPVLRYTYIFLTYIFMKRTLLFLTSLMVLASCGGPKTITLSSPDGSKQVKIDVEVADNTIDRTNGLKNRSSLAEGHGMLFVFPVPQKLSFWMQETRIPLDIMFFDVNGRFISGMDMQPCSNDPCPQYTAPEVGQYVLEANKGYRNKNGIGVGWMLDLKEINAISSPE